jgi:peptide/nickel transport system substrate-binding protein
MLNATKGFFVFLFFVSVLGGCRSEDHAPRQSDAQTLTIAIESAPGRIDPRFATDAFAGRIGGLVYASLVRMGPTGEFLPYLARKWTWEDERTCLFELEDRFAFADGSPVTAADVVATYASVLEAGGGSPRRALLEGVEAVEPDGRARVRFRLAAASSPFLEGATMGILSAKQAMAGDLDDVALLASGPYRIAALDRNAGALLERNPGYRAGTVPIPRIRIRVVPDSLTRVLELRSGAVDMVQSAIDPDTVAWLEEHAPELRIASSPSANLQYLGMNLRHEALGDARVRRAIAYALDRESLVEHLLDGQARVAHSFLPPEHWAHTTRVLEYENLPSRARALLDAAGWRDPDGDGPNPRLTLSYKTTTDDLARRIAEAIAAQLGAVGIALDVRSYDWGTFFADVRSGNFQLYALQWVGIGDPDMLRHVLHSSMVPPAGNNRGGYSDPATDRLTEEARWTIDPARRRALYAKVEQRSARLLPFIPLWWPDRVVVSGSRVIGFEAHPSGDLAGLLATELRAN